MLSGARRALTRRLTVFSACKLQAATVLRHWESGRATALSHLEYKGNCDMPCNL